MIALKSSGLWEPNTMSWCSLFFSPKEVRMFVAAMEVAREAARLLGESGCAAEEDFESAFQDVVNLGQSAVKAARAVVSTDCSPSAGAALVYTLARVLEGLDTLVAVVAGQVEVVVRIMRSADPASLATLRQDLDNFEALFQAMTPHGFRAQIATALPPMVSEELTRDLAEIDRAFGQAAQSRQFTQPDIVKGIARHRALTVLRGVVWAYCPGGDGAN